MSSTAYLAIKSSQKLPSPTGVALRILELTQNDSVGIPAIASVVESDPAIASRLIKLVNTPLAGLPRKVASVQRAVALLGIKTVRSMALCFSLVANNREGECTGFDYERFWSESLARAAASRHIANLTKCFAPDEAFTCGLVSQIGRLSLATAFPSQYTITLKRVAETESVGLSETERLDFEIDHNELAAEMMLDWRMPGVFCQAVRMQDAPAAGPLGKLDRDGVLARVLNLSGAVAEVLTQPTVYKDMLAAVIVHATHLEISPHVYNDMFGTITEEWRDAGAILTVKTQRVPSLAEMYSLAKDRLGESGAESDERRRSSDTGTQHVR